MIFSMIRKLATLLLLLVSAIAQAAYTHVQTVAGSAQTASVTISITAGNLVIVTGMFTTGGGSSDFTPTTNTSAVFTSAVDTGASPNNYQVRSYYLLNAGSGITSVTATFDVGTPGEYGFVVSEYSGIATTSALVGSAAAVDEAPGTGTDAITSGNTGTLTSQPALIYEYAFNQNYSAITQGTGFASRLTSAFGGNLQVADRRVTATTAVAGTFTSTDGTANYNVFVLAFAEPGGAASGLLLRRRRN
jgi:hypothetical protein